MNQADTNSPEKEASRELNEILEIVKAAWEERENPDARLEMVQEMLAKEFKTGQIVRVVMKAFDCSMITVKRDIAKAKKSFLDYLRENDQEKHLSKSVNRMIAVIRQAYKDGDARAVIQASKHHDQLLGLIDAEITIGGKLDLTLEKIRDELSLKLAGIAKSGKKKRVSKKPDK